MKNFLRLAICSFSFSFVANTLFFWLCYLGMDKCQMTKDTSSLEMLSAFLIVLGLLFLFGFGVAFLIDLVIRFTVGVPPQHRLFSRLVGGGAVGYSVRAIVGILYLREPVLTALNFPAAHLSFAVAGIVGAYFSHLLFVSSTC